MGALVPKPGMILGLMLALASPLGLAHAREPHSGVPVQLHAGQELVYQMHYRVERDTKTESRVIAPIAPPAEPIDLLRSVRVKILEAGGGRLPASTRLQVEIAPAGSPPESPAKRVQFALDAAGNVSDTDGIESLTPGERELWRDWVERFAAVWAFPSNLKPGQKWTSEEPVEDAVIAGLVWRKQSQYVRDEPCPRTSAAPSIPADTCAVVLSSATLSQKSSPKDSTPEEYKLHDLKTSGTARGNNQIISYVSRASGVIARVAETAVQTMDVAISKTDGSNAVSYRIAARSQSEILLTSNSASEARPPI
ncbi:MAG TPA: hypothetical protein VFA13_02015 [Candidatus Acidoferrum sp.]|nr:hypothetical protein [Candidatus Acidoferrum sp.]